MPTSITLRPVPAHLVEEVAREFQLDEIEPILAGPIAHGNGPSRGHTGIAAKSGRIAGSIARGQYRAVFLRARKETMSRIHEALKKAEQERAAVATSHAPAYLRPRRRTSDEAQCAGRTGQSEGGRILPTEAVVAHSAGLPALRRSADALRASGVASDPNVNVFINPAIDGARSGAISDAAITPVPDASHRSRCGRCWLPVRFRPKERHS